MTPVICLGQLKALAREAPDNRLEGFIQLNGCISRKDITYYADLDERRPRRNRKVWECFEYISDCWVQYTDKSLMDSNIGWAIQHGAFYVDI